MLIESDTPFPTRERVLVDVPSFSYSGKATVVWCARKAKNFRMGLYFDAVIPFYLDVRRELLALIDN
jgi:hypothetical protein